MVGQGPANEQEAIAGSDKAQLLLVSPPGCGKTELLAMRAQVLIERLAKNQRILALTFSNKARQNLRQRLTGIVGRTQSHRYISVYNFHGLSATILRAHGKLVDVDPSFPMPGKRTLAAAVRPWTEGMNIGAAIRRGKEIEDVLRRSKAAPISDEEVLLRLEQSGDHAALSIERDRQQSGQMHYDDILRHAQRILQIPAVSTMYQHHFGGLIVDEFQDLSLQQLDISVKVASTSRTFAGDPLQGIYSWAGASPVEVEAFLVALCGEPSRLTTSYRSSPAVLDVVNSVAVPLGSHRLEAHSPGMWHRGGAAAAVTLQSGIEEADWLTSLASKITTKWPAATVGVIARSAWRRRMVDEAFAQSNISYVQWDLAINAPHVLSILRQAVKTLPKEAGIAQLREVASALADGVEVETYDDLIAAVDQLEGIVTEHETIQDAVARLKHRDPGKAVPAGAHLLNAHTGKGQQFDWVFVPGFESFHIPSGQASSQEELAEEERALLVILSRARHGLVLTRASTLVAKSGRTYSPDESAYWPRVLAACALDRKQLEDHIETMPGPT